MFSCGFICPGKNCFGVCQSVLLITSLSLLYFDSQFHNSNFSCQNWKVLLREIMRKRGKGVGFEYPLRSRHEITGRYFWHKIAGASWWSCVNVWIHNFEDAKEESKRQGLNLSGSWQQGHSATYNTPSRI